MESQQQQRQTAAERLAQNKRTIDTLLENVDNLTPILIAREERYGYGDRQVALGWAKICEWLEEVDKLEEDRRRLRQQPTACAS